MESNRPDPAGGWGQIICVQLRKGSKLPSTCEECFGRRFLLPTSFSAAYTIKARGSRKVPPALAHKTELKILQAELKPRKSNLVDEHFLR